MEEVTGWPSDLIRAALPVAVLAAIEHRSLHGYALLSRLAELGLAVKGGTVYPLLARQEDLGRIFHVWETGGSGPARKVFSITEEGRAELGRLADAWRRMDVVVRESLKAAPGHEMNSRTTETM